jgi:hypothetical protein
MGVYRINSDINAIEEAIGIGRIDIDEKVCCIKCKNPVDDVVIKYGICCPHCRGEQFVGIREYKNHITGRIKYAEGFNVR